MAQAAEAPAAQDLYRNAYGYSDFDMTRLDPDVSSNEIMDINDVILGRKLHGKAAWRGYEHPGSKRHRHYRCYRTLYL